MAARRVDTICERDDLDRLVALKIVLPVILDRVRVRDKPAIAVGVDIRASGALGELTRVFRLLRPGLRSPAEDVARVDAEQQGDQQNNQTGATADCALSSSSPTAAHLRRIELRTLVVLHISPLASSWAARLDQNIAVSLELGRARDSFGISDRSAARLWPYTRFWLS